MTQSDPSSAPPSESPPLGRPHHHRPPSPPGSSPPQRPQPLYPPTTPISPAVTSTDLESDPESISDVSSIPPSEDDRDDGGRADGPDLAASAWEDLGSSAHRSQDSFGTRDHSRRPSTSSYAYSSSGRSRDGDEEYEETSADETPARPARYTTEDDIDGILATYIDLEPSLHSDRTLTDTSAEDASRAGAAASTASISSTATTTTTTHDGSPANRATTSTLPSFELSYPDPSTVASSFSSAQGSQHVFRPGAHTDGDRVARVGAVLPSCGGGERPRPSYARAAGRRLTSDRLTASSSWVGGSDSLFPNALDRTTSSPAVDSIDARLSSTPVLALSPEKPTRSSIPATLLALPPRVQIVYLGLSPSQSYFDSLLRTLLNLLDASLPPGHDPVPALLKQYDLLGGTRSSKTVADIREPFRKERRVSQGATAGVSKKTVCEISVGDLTVEHSDEVRTSSRVDTEWLLLICLDVLPCAAGFDRDHQGPSRHARPQPTDHLPLPRV